LVNGNQVILELFGGFMQIDESVVFITGAGSGIGQAAAILLAKQGAKIGALDISDEQLKETIDTITADGGQVIGLPADVSQPYHVEQAVQQLVDKWGRIDAVFANAGINGKWAPIEELTADDWDKTLNINLKGTFLTVKYAAPHLKKQGGSIVVTASVNGTRMFSNTGASAYSSSKAGQVAFTKMIALELAKYKIRANVICPGAITTNIGENTQKSDNLAAEKPPVDFPEGSIPLTHGQPGRSEDVAQLVLFLVSDASKHISGTEIWIDGAQSLLMG